MQDDFRKSKDVSDILRQVREKKETEVSDNAATDRLFEDLRDIAPKTEYTRSSDVNAAKNTVVREPVFHPVYRENEDITFMTSPIIDLKSDTKSKPQGPVFGFEYEKTVEKTSMSQKFAAMKDEFAIGNSFAPLKKEKIIQPKSVQIPVPPSAEAAKVVLQSAVSDKRQESETVADDLAGLPPQVTAPSSVSVATPIASTTFSAEKKIKTTTYEIKEKSITKEMRTPTPTLKGLLDIENKIDLMESSDLNSEDAETIPTTTGAIRVETFGDEKFFNFFSETVAVDKSELRAGIKAQKRKKGNRNYFNTDSINTTDVPSPVPFMMSGEEHTDVDTFAVSEQEDIDDYNNLGDAPGILQDLKRMVTVATVRFFAVLFIAVVSFYFTAAIFYEMPLPSMLSGPGGESALYAVIGFLTLSLGIVIGPTMIKGFLGFFAEPTQDSFVFLTIVASFVQLIALNITNRGITVENITIFAPVAMLAAVVSSFGRMFQLEGISDSFSIATDGFDHSAAYLVNNKDVVSKLTGGIYEEFPELMLSRPTALVKNFLRQSFSPHSSDKSAKRFAIVIFFAAIISGGISYYLGDGGIMRAISSFTATISISAPLAAIFVLVLPTILMNKSAARVGAVIPGWEAIEGIGKTTVVMLNSHDIFPPTTVKLHGIKTFNKERIDLAILYAASVLTVACDTLRDIFLAIIEGNTEMLYGVEGLTRDVGYGFSAWVDGKRVTIGSREMMEKNEIMLPSVDFENKFSRSERSVIYLAVAGKLFCMFLVSYKADDDVSETINVMRRSGLSILIKSDDFNITKELVSNKFKISPENVKVLSGKELEIAARYTSYLPESEGLITHFGSFTSFIGGLRAAAAADSAERMASILEVVTVILSVIISLLLSLTSGIAALPLSAVLLYQLAWMLITIAAIIFKRY